MAHSFKVKSSTSRFIEDFEIDLTVTCEYTPGCRGSGPMSYYGPTPDDPPEVNILEIVDSYGNDLYDLFYEDLQNDQTFYEKVCEEVAEREKDYDEDREDPNDRA